MLRRLTDVPAPEGVTSTLLVKSLLAESAASSKAPTLTVGRRQSGNNLVLRSQARAYFAGVGQSRATQSKARRPPTCAGWSGAREPAAGPHLAGRDGRGRDRGHEQRERNLRAQPLLRLARARVAPARAAAAPPESWHSAPPLQPCSTTRPAAARQVNAVRLEPNAKTALKCGDVVAFGGPVQASHVL